MLKTIANTVGIKLATPPIEDRWFVSMDYNLYLKSILLSLKFKFFVPSL